MKYIISNVSTIKERAKKVTNFFVEKNKKYFKKSIDKAKTKWYNKERSRLKKRTKYIEK